jgi:hypothetical protein
MLEIVCRQGNTTCLVVASAKLKSEENAWILSRVVLDHSMECDSLIV